MARNITPGDTQGFNDDTGRPIGMPLDPTVPIFNAITRFIGQKYPHVRNPVSIMTVVAYNGTGAPPNTSTAQHAGDPKPNGVNMPHLIPYGTMTYTLTANTASPPVYTLVPSGPSTPAPNDVVVVQNTPYGPYIHGKLSA